MTGWPPTETVPLVGLASPSHRIRSSVDFPQPERPTMETKLPRLEAERDVAERLDRAPVRLEALAHALGHHVRRTDPHQLPPVAVGQRYLPMSVGWGTTPYFTPTLIHALALATLQSPEPVVIGALA